MTLGGRTVGAAAVLLLGVAFCFVMYWWQLRYEYAYRGLGLNLFMAIPFAALAAMVIGGMSRIATILGWLTLATLTGLVYVEVPKDESSTAAIAYLVPLFYGVIMLSIIFAVDSILRARGRQEPRTK